MQSPTDDMFIFAFHRLIHSWRLDPEECLCTCLFFHIKMIEPLPCPVVYVVANPGRGLLDTKREGKYLQSSNANAKNKSDKIKGNKERKNTKKVWGSERRRELTHNADAWYINKRAQHKERYLLERVLYSTIRDHTRSHPPGSQPPRICTQNTDIDSTVLSLSLSQGLSFPIGTADTASGVPRPVQSKRL